MGFILDRRLKATPHDITPILNRALRALRWTIVTLENIEESTLSYSIFGRQPAKSDYLAPSLGWITITGVQNESQVRLFCKDLNSGTFSLHKEYLDLQPYPIEDMFRDLAASLIRTLEGDRFAQEWLEEYSLPAQATFTDSETNEPMTKKVGPPKSQDIRIASRWEKVKKLSEKGESIESIAKLTGVTPATIVRDRRALGISSPRGKHGT